MKRNVFIFFLSTMLFLSCSKDESKQDDVDPASAIVGSWRAIEFKAADPNNTNVNLGAEILDLLTAEECYILLFDFRADLTVEVENAVNYIVPNLSGVDCPTQSDIESSTYTYDGTTLTTIDTDGVTIMVKVSIDGNTMSADAADLNIPNFDGAGEIVFERF